jgi:hypothetical protein
MDAGLFPLHPVEDRKYEPARLWWAHERLHRACLRDFARRRAAFSEERERFQRESLDPLADPLQAWKAHRDLVDEWYAKAVEVRHVPMPRLASAYWRRQSQAAAMV